MTAPYRCEHKPRCICAEVAEASHRQLCDALNAKREQVEAAEGRWRGERQGRAAAEAEAGRLREALTAKIHEWHVNGRAEKDPLIAGTWKLCADDVSAALAAGAKP